MTESAGNRHVDNVIKECEPRKRKYKLRIAMYALLLMALVCIAFYFLLGVFVIQPIGAIPDGATIVFWRYDTKLPFVSSADGLLLEKAGKVTLLGRALVLGKVGEAVNQRKIAQLPYSRTLYLISTGGKELDN